MAQQAAAVDLLERQPAGARRTGHGRLISRARVACTVLVRPRSDHASCSSPGCPLAAATRARQHRCGHHLGRCARGHRGASVGQTLGLVPGSRCDLDSRHLEVLPVCAGSHAHSCTSTSPWLGSARRLRPRLTRLCAGHVEQLPIQLPVELEHGRLRRRRRTRAHPGCGADDRHPGRAVGSTGR